MIAGCKIRSQTAVGFCSCLTFRKPIKIDATKLQEAANLGGIGIIVAQRKIDGKSGHIVAAFPETDNDKAKRDGGGLVTSPLQSQAGVTNFRYRAAPTQWWTGDQFADSAFWIHA